MRLLRTDSDNEDFRRLVGHLDVYLAEMDGEEHSYYAQFNGLDRINNVVVAFEQDEAVGCGAFKPYKESTAEIKRMFVSPEHRGKRIGLALLKELEYWAAESGFKTCILETGHRQVAAVKLYSGAGYTVIPNYDQYEGIENSVCMRKEIALGD
jgi:putative acetyltransferase